MDLNVNHEISAEALALAVDDMSYEYQRAFWAEVGTYLRQFDSTGRSIDAFRDGIMLASPHTHDNESAQ